MKATKLSLGQAVSFNLSFGSQFKLGKKVYTFISTTTDMIEQEVSFISTGEKKIIPCTEIIIVLKDEKNEYKALLLKDHEKKQIEIIK